MVQNEPLGVRKTPAHGREKVIMASDPQLDDSILRDMRMDEAAISRRHQFLNLTKADADLLIKIRPLVKSNLDMLTACFFDRLTKMPESRDLQSSTTALATARQLKQEHLLAMVSGDYGLTYVNQRIRLARLYSSVGIPLPLFTGAYAALIEGLIHVVITQQSGDSATVAAVEKVAFFDVSVMSEGIIFDRERVIQRQEEAIREISTPVLQLRDRMLLMPLVGLIDSRRARLITEDLLAAIRHARAKAVVMDITGVAAVDSKVASHLMQTVSAARLMGATVVVTGLSAEVAQSLVALGGDYSGLNTVGDLQGGIEVAERLLGLRVVSSTTAPPRHTDINSSAVG